MGLREGVLDDIEKSRELRKYNRLTFWLSCVHSGQTSDEGTDTGGVSGCRDAADTAGSEST